MFGGISRLCSNEEIPKRRWQSHAVEKIQMQALEDGGATEERAVWKKSSRNIPRGSGNLSLNTKLHMRPDKQQLKSCVLSSPQSSCRAETPSRETPQRSHFRSDATPVLG